MKAFNVSHYDDRRLCFKRTCEDSVIAFQWDHAVRDFQDPEWRLSTVCCEENQCADPALRIEEGLRCMHKLHTDPACASPTVNDAGELPLFRGKSNKLRSDEEWIRNPL